MRLLPPAGRVDYDLIGDSGVPPVERSADCSADSHQPFPKRRSQ